MVAERSHSSPSGQGIDSDVANTWWLLSIGEKMRGQSFICLLLQMHMNDPRSWRRRWKRGAVRSTSWSLVPAVVETVMVVCFGRVRGNGFG